jgi:hypothetical protein
VQIKGLANKLPEQKIKYEKLLDEDKEIINDCEIQVKSSENIIKK